MLLNELLQLNEGWDDETESEILSFLNNGESYWEMTIQHAISKVGFGSGDTYSKVLRKLEDDGIIEQDGSQQGLPIWKRTDKKLSFGEIVSKAKMERFINNRYVRETLSQKFSPKLVQFGEDGFIIQVYLESGSSYDRPWFKDNANKAISINNLDHVVEIESIERGDDDSAIINYKLIK